MKFFQKPSLLLLGITFSLIGCASDESTESISASSIGVSSSSVGRLSSVVLSSATRSSIAMSSMVVSSILASSSSSIAAVVYDSLTDSRDNQVYKTVMIGTQTWMAQNLNYGNYISDGESSSTLQSGAQKFCYSNTESNCTTDGGLYQWHTVMGFASSCATTSCVGQISTGNHQGICPVGWHVPKITEWDALQTYLGGSTVAGSKMKLNNTGNSSWDASTYNTGNSSGFSALPAGARVYYGGFNIRGSYADFWEATESNASNAYSRNLNNGSSNLYRYNGSGKANGFSVRCVKD